MHSSYTLTCTLHARYMHTTNTVLFSQAGITWAVKHRYSEFLTLFQHLRRCPQLRQKKLIECLSFPPKRFGSLSEVQLEIRRVRLDRFTASVAELSQYCSAFSLGALAQVGSSSSTYFIHHTLMHHVLLPSHRLHWHSLQTRRSPRSATR
jgi:hypothetical protein